MVQVLNAVARENDLFVVSRDETGTRKVTRAPIDHACFLRASDVSERLARQLSTSTKLRYVRDEGEWLRLGFKRGWDLREVGRALEIDVFEADVHPVRRWLTDTAPEIAKPRRCYLDLETDSRVPFSRKAESRILAWSITDDDQGWAQSVLEEDTDAAETDLLRDLWSILDSYDQVLSWNGDRFDFEVLRARTDKHDRKRAGQWDLWLWLDQLALFKRMNTAAESGDEKTSMALDSVAHALLGEGKADFDASKTWEVWSSGEEGREALLRYNLRDVELQRRIEEKTGFADLLFELGKIARCFPESRSINGSTIVEGFLLALGAEHGVRFGPKPYGAEENPFKGAYVMEPTRTGIIPDVHVADFAGMYPSIIESWNISPETYENFSLISQGTPSYLAHVEGSRIPCPADMTATPSGMRCFSRTKPGMLALAVSELGRLRQVYNKKKAECTPGTPEWHSFDLQSTACKVARNTFYGVVSSPVSRFYRREAGEAVTTTGVYLIQKTIEAAEGRGYSVIYCDTDSIFVTGCTEESFRVFVTWCNEELYPKIAAECNCITNTIKLEYEKAFERLVMVGKKRYAAKYAHYKGKRATADSKPEIKGIEYKRGDSAKLARRMQECIVVDLLAGEAEPLHYRAIVEEWRAIVLTGPLELSDVVLAKSLGKPLREYSIDRTPPPHVGVARQLAERGVDVGESTRIEYIVTNNGSPQQCRPACDCTVADANRDYLWESLVWPASKRVLEACFPREPWGDFDTRAKGKQQKLF